LLYGVSKSQPCATSSTPALHDLIFHANLLERRDAVLGVFAFNKLAFNKLGMNCCSGDSKNASLRSQYGKPQRTQTLSLARNAQVQWCLA
jgi:hypothetical protein